MPPIALKILKSPWTWVVLLAIILIIVVKLKGWNPLDFFKPASGSGDERPTAEDKATAQAMATELHTEMAGVNLTRNLVPWRKFMRMNERMQRIVYQEFSTLFSGDERGTLTQWVNDESAVFPTWNDSEGVASRAQIVSRLSSLNLP